MPQARAGQWWWTSSAEGCAESKRLGVVLLLVFLIPTTLIFHGDVADRMERIQLLKNLAIIGGLLLVADQDRGG